MIVTASHVSTNSFLVVSAGQRVGTGERRAARQCRASAGEEHVCTVAIQPSPRLAGVHALPPARSVSRMMCVMPALKPIKAVRCGGLEVSSFGKRWTGAHTRVRERAKQAQVTPARTLPLVPPRALLGQEAQRAAAWVCASANQTSDTVHDCGRAQHGAQHSTQGERRKARTFEFLVGHEVESKRFDEA